MKQELQRSLARYPIAVEDITVDFTTGFRKPRFRALNGVTLHADAGEIVGILGPNGSGKTTLLRVLSGLLRPASGKATVLGLHPADRSLVDRVGYQPEGNLPFPLLNGTEFLQYMGDLMHLPPATIRDRTSAWFFRLGLADAGRKAVRHYSTGMRRRLGLAAALLAEPEVLLLDEPTSGLDPDGSIQVMDILRERAAAGCTVLLASHHLQEVEQICQRVYLFRAGRILSEGTLDELLGTGSTSFVVRNLDDAGLSAVEATVREAGGEILSTGKEREHLFALFRRLQPKTAAGPANDTDARPLT